MLNIPIHYKKINSHAKVGRTLRGRCRYPNAKGQKWIPLNKKKVDTIQIKKDRMFVPPKSKFEIIAI